jgi:hypothetical protein
MSKRARNGNRKKGQPMTEEAPPPFLNEQLIAQLQAAVNAAQRKRRSEPYGSSAGRSPEKEL